MKYLLPQNLSKILILFFIQLKNTEKYHRRLVSRDLGSFRKQNGEGETDGRPKNRVKIPYLGAIIGIPWREECSVTVCLSV